MLEFWVDKDQIPNEQSAESDDYLPIYVIHRETRDKKSIYRLEYEPISTTKLFELRSTHYVWESYDKPLNGVSTYKNDQIKDICRKLHIDTTSKKYNKNELYKMISDKIGPVFS